MTDTWEWQGSSPPPHFRNADAGIEFVDGVWPVRVLWSDVFLRDVVRVHPEWLCLKGRLLTIRCVNSTATYRLDRRWKDKGIFGTVLVS